MAYNTEKYEATSEIHSRSELLAQRTISTQMLFLVDHPSEHTFCQCFAARPRASSAYHPETSPQQGISVSDSAGSGSGWSGRSDSSSAEDTSKWHCSADSS